MTMSQEALVGLGTEFLYPNYRQPPLVLVRGQGSALFDVGGKRYLDFFAGIAVSTLGHGHPRLVRAIAEQAERLIHASNYFFNEPNVRLAARLCRLSGMARAFFCNSGTEAIEASLKLARRHFFAKGQPERLRIIAFENSFHGRTLGALAATGQPKYRDGFGPLPAVSHVPYGDARAVQAAMGPDVAAVLVEPVQGEGGVLPAPQGFLAELRRITLDNGALLIFDEVQTGIGRTGTFLACQGEGIQPDVVALAKALGGGVPIGAMLTQAALSDALPPGSHGSTFGGNPLASAAAHAVLDAIEEDGLLEHVKQTGEYLRGELETLARKHDKLVTGTRGRGLLQALLLKDGVDARQVLSKLQDAGVLLTVAGGQALRFSPPLVVTRAELDEGLARVDSVLGSIAG
ncbi:MAG TPA: acetylornithine transaminase [Polyangiaceae bacterium]|nr:acetylornithine transaminase [Polyangiaceae bacterium]